MPMSKIKLLLYSASTGLLLALAWPEIGGAIKAMFIALFPLLWVEDYISKEKGTASLQVFTNAYVAFLVFNALTTYWIYYASDWGAVMAIVCNSFFMAVVFWLFHLTKNKVGRKEGYIGLVVYWIAFEYLHLNWELSWTWLTFGNVFANRPNLVQWYEYTGVLGGSILVWLVNFLVFAALKDLKFKSQVWIRYLVFAVVLVLISYGVSTVMVADFVPKGSKVEVVIVQPNIDPYNEKFGGKPASQQIDEMIALAKQKLSPTTDYLIFPETAIPEAHWEHEINYLYATEEIRKLNEISPNLKTIIGSSSSVLYTPGMEFSATANAFRDGTGHYDNYNAALQIDATQEVQIHHKSKLVLGVEKLPFIRSIPLMKKLSINLGGTSGGLGTQESPSVFKSQDGSVVAPIICYESIYGEYVTEYTKKGANLFAIITNDGWWDDTPGYKQHLAYARLRAIENRRSIVRSANTGISAIINQKGELIEQTEWWEPAVISGRVSLNNELTFYARYGDYLGRIAGFMAPLLILLTIVKSLNKTGQRLSLKKG